MSAQERREEVLRAAAAAFAASGFEGTTTEDVARRAGISQPYIFRLFRSKKELFLEVVERCFAKTVAVFEEAAKGRSGLEALEVMGQAYMDLVRDPVTLLVQMHAFTAAANDPVVRRAAQRGVGAVWEVASTASGLDDAHVRDWLAMGMLINLVAALGLESLDERWAKCLLSSPDCP